MSTNTRTLSLDQRSALVAGTLLIVFIGAAIFLTLRQRRAPTAELQEAHNDDSIDAEEMDMD